MSKLVKKSNFLVPLEEAVSKPAQLLASYIIASLPKSKVEISELPSLEFPYVELRRALNADGRERVNKIRDIMDLGVELQRCVLFYEDDFEERTVTWLIDQKRNKSDNSFTYTLHPGLKKYLINIEKHFTKYNYLFRVCLNLHSMKLYEILKMYEYKGEVVMDIEKDIKMSLGLSGKYPKIYDLKRRVLNVAQKEIKKYTDISFEYEDFNKKGKTPISFRFIINKNEPTDLSAELLEKFSRAKINPFGPKSIEGKKGIPISEKEFPGEYKVLLGWGGNKEVISTLIENYGITAIRYQINHLQRLLKSRNNIKNNFAWYLKALKDDFRDLVQDQRKSTKIKVENVKKAKLRKANIEKGLKGVEQKYYEKVREVCDQLIEDKPSLLDQTIEEVKDSLIIRRAISNEKTNLDLYKDKKTVGVIYAKIQENYPELFESLVEEFNNQTINLKKSFNEVV